MVNLTGHFGLAAVKRLLKPKAVAIEENTPVIAPDISYLHRGNAYWMALFSRLVYRNTGASNKRPDEAFILEALQQKDRRFLAVTGYNKNHAQAMLVEHASYISMVFRGTDELVDWLDNLNIAKKETEFGVFHKGFYDSLYHIWPQMEQDYLDLEKKSRRVRKPLFITGHSLGGAIASIAAAKCLYDQRPFVSVYTFGQPRALSLDSVPAFNAACADRFFRMQNHHDLVSHTPANIAHYGHVGHCLYIDEFGALHTDPGWWFKFLDTVEGAAMAIRKWRLDLLKQHDMYVYMDAIERWQLEDWGAL